MHAVVQGGLNTHVPRPEVVNPSLGRLYRHLVLEPDQGLVALTNDPLVWLLDARRVGSHQEDRQVPSRATTSQSRARTRFLVDCVEH